MIDRDDLIQTIENSFKQVTEFGSDVLLEKADIIETEWQWRNTLFVMTDASLHNSLPDVLVTLMTDLDKSGMDSVVRALIPDPEYNEPDRFDGYDVNEANAILLWLSYIRQFEDEADPDDIEAAEAFWTAKLEALAEQDENRRAKHERTKDKRKRAALRRIQRN